MAMGMYYKPFAAGAGLAYQAMSQPRKTGQQFTAGGTNSYTVSKKRRKTYGNRNSFAKRVLAVEAAHHSTISDSTSATAMVQNTIYTFGPTQAITQGTGNTGREGDSIYLCALKVGMTLVSDVASAGYSYRVLVGYSGEEVAATGAFSTGLGTSAIFLPNSGGGNLTTAIVNPKAFTVVDDRVVEINSLISAAADLKTLTYTVQLNTKFPYKATASVYGKHRNLYFVVIGFRSGGGGATAVGNVYVNTDLVFKNL